MKHTSLHAWQKSLDLAESVYSYSKMLPKTENYGLCSQMQRAAVSVLSNIAEGAALNSTKAYVRHLNIARGSLAELDTQLILSERVFKTDSNKTKELKEKIYQVGQLLGGLIRYQRTKIT